MFQFIHIESYSRVTPKTGKKGGHSVSSIINEAVREDGNCPHVESPNPPIYIYGNKLESIEAKCDEWAESITDSRGHKTRKDALCLLAGVVSVEAGIDPEAWKKVKVDTVKWLREKYGDRLQSVIEHTDEANPHLHFYCVPLPGERFDQVHDGRRAAADLKGEKKGEQNKAYKQAMRGFQDDFSMEVGIPSGMARFGPGKRRLSREGWKQEQEQVKAIAVSLAASQELRGAARKEAANVIREATIKVDRAEAAAVQRGERRALESFTRKSIFGKLAELVTGVSRENRELRSRLKSTESLLESWKAKAIRYESKGRDLLERLKIIKPRYRDMEAEVSKVGRLTRALEEAKERLEESERDLYLAKGLIADNSATIEMYRDREDERDALAKTDKPRRRQLDRDDSSLAL